MTVNSIVDLSHMPVYVPGASDIPGSPSVIKLSSNESALGPSPLALEAYREASGMISRYPEPTCLTLRDALAAKHGLNADRIVCAMGSESLIRLIVRTFAGPGDEVVHSAHGFSLYRVAAAGVGAVPVSVPEVGLIADPGGVLNAITERTRIVLLANPNNPTGTMVDPGDMQRFIEALPENLLLVLDSAYAEYVKDADYDSGLKWVKEGLDNLIVLRTFSKIYSLAGLRVGWAYSGQSIADVLRKVADVFGVSAPSQATAIAALDDEEHIARELAHVGAWRPWLTQALEGLGFVVTPSHTNFLLVHCDDLRLSAAECIEGLMVAGIIVRPLDNYGLPNAMRITVGRENENRALIQALSDIAGR